MQKAQKYAVLRCKGDTSRVEIRLRPRLLLWTIDVMAKDAEMSCQALTDCLTSEMSSSVAIVILISSLLLGWHKCIILLMFETAARALEPGCVEQRKNLQCRRHGVQACED